MRKIIFLLVASFVLATAVPTPTLAGDYHTLELREKFSISFDVCGGMFGLLFGYRNYSGCRMTLMVSGIVSGWTGILSNYNREEFSSLL